MTAILQAAHSSPVFVALSFAAYVLLLSVALLFGGAPLITRVAVIGSLVLTLAALASLEAKRFFALRRSLSSAFLLIAGSALLISGFASLGHQMSSLAFFGLVPLSAGVAFVWATVQFFRFRALQFLLECAASAIAAGVSFFAGALM